MINCYFCKYHSKHHQLIWKLPGSNFREEIKNYNPNYSRKTIKKFLMKKNSKSCFNNRNKLLNHHPILNSKQLASFCLILLMQFSTSTSCLSVETTPLIESKKILNSSKNDNYENKNLSAENIVIENFRFNDLPLI